LDHKSTIVLNIMIMIMIYTSENSTLQCSSSIYLADNFFCIYVLHSALGTLQHQFARIMPAHLTPQQNLPYDIFFHTDTTVI